MKNKNIIIMKALEIDIDSAINTMLTPENTQLQLNNIISKSFDYNTANKIIDNCQFILVNQGKLGVRVNQVNLSNNDKNELRACIRAVYGNDIHIISLPPLKAINIEPKDSRPISINNNLTWIKVKNNLCKHFSSKISEDVLKTWFDKLEVSEDLADNKLILIGSGFYIARINSDFGEEIEYVAIKNKIKIELRYRNNNHPEIIYPFKRMSETKLNQLINKKY